jgi:hypothetical protein
VRGQAGQALPNPSLDAVAAPVGCGYARGMARVPRSGILLTLTLFGVAACSGESEVADAAIDAGTIADSGVGDDAATAPDAASADAEVVDAGPADAGLADAGPAGVDCSGATLRVISTDTATTGPWAVGVRTATVAGLVTEIWYPAPPESAAGVPRAVYDIREQLPASERGKIPDDANPWQVGEGRRDLPLDTDFGPYPVVLFVHGTASFRTQSLAQMTHWASRGFVVVAADHPGLMLRDLLGLACGGGLVQQDLQRDLRNLLAALDAPAGELAFLAGHIDMARLAMAGHSAGGAAIKAQGARAAVLMPLASGGTEPGAALVSTLVMGADQDQVVDYTRTRDAYDATPSPKRLVGLAGTGHLAFANLCSLTNAQGQDLVEIGTERGVCGVGLASGLFDCSDAYLPDAEAWEIIDDATAAALEETLHCRPEAGARFDGLLERYGAQIAEVVQER